MALMSSYEQNVLLEAEFNGVAPTLPADFYVALYIASLGEYVSGLTTTLGATIVPSTPNNRIYKVTTVGTTALTPSTEPTWPTTDGGTVTDANGNVWTEQTPSIKAGTINEASGGGYARQSVANTTTNWTLTTNSIGNKNVANAVTISFGSVTANPWIRRGGRSIRCLYIRQPTIYCRADDPAKCGFWQYPAVCRRNAQLYRKLRRSCDNH